MQRRTATAGLMMLAATAGADPAHAAAITLEGQTSQIREAVVMLTELLMYAAVTGFTYCVCRVLWDALTGRMEFTKIWNALLATAVVGLANNCTAAISGSNNISDPRLDSRQATTVQTQNSPSAAAQTRNRPGNGRRVRTGCTDTSTCSYNPDTGLYTYTATGPDGRLQQQQRRLSPRDARAMGLERQVNPCQRPGTRCDYRGGQVHINGEKDAAIDMSEEDARRAHGDSGFCTPPVQCHTHLGGARETVIIATKADGSRHRIKVDRGQAERAKLNPQTQQGRMEDNVLVMQDGTRIITPEENPGQDRS